MIGEVVVPLVPLPVVALVSVGEPVLCDPGELAPEPAAAPVELLPLLLPVELPLLELLYPPLPGAMRTELGGAFGATGLACASAAAVLPLT